MRACRLRSVTTVDLSSPPVSFPLFCLTWTTVRLNLHSTGLQLSGPSGGSAVTGMDPGSCSSSPAIARLSLSSDVVSMSFKSPARAVALVALARMAALAAKCLRRLSCLSNAPPRVDHTAVFKNVSCSATT